MYEPVAIEFAVSRPQSGVRVVPRRVVMIAEMNLQGPGSISCVIA
uniref:ARAD1D33583p n=1 Tax=Blastobotrys adeninivorans TaxID=409370 RepID=A0A060TBA4_BLAAD